MVRSVGEVGPSGDPIDIESAYRQGWEAGRSGSARTIVFGRSGDYAVYDRALSHEEVDAIWRAASAEADPERVDMEDRLGAAMYHPITGPRTRMCPDPSVHDRAAAPAGADPEPRWAEAFREFESVILTWTHPDDAGHVLNAITRLRFAIESEARAQGGPSLDVEDLAAQLDNHYRNEVTGRYETHLGWECECGEWDSRTSTLRWSEHVAARLSVGESQ